MGLVDLLKRNKRNKPTDESRRRFLKTTVKAVAGAAVGGNLLYELVNPKDAYAFSMPSDATLLQYMNQPVEDTLKDTNVTYVDDNNYQREVFQEHLPAGQRRPVMVLFYNNRGKPDQGNAALSRVLSDRFPELKFCAYKLGNGERTPRDVFDNVLERYPPLRQGMNTPALLFYTEKNGITQYNDDISLIGGLVTLNRIKSDIKFYFQNIPKAI